MISRRRMLIASGLAGSAALLSRSLLGAPNTAVKQVALTNLHTGEKLTVERPDGTATYSSPGRPIAVVSNVKVSYRPGPAPRPAAAKKPAPAKKN